MQDPTVTTTEHPVPGGEEVDVTIIFDPTPAGDVHPSTPVVPADAPFSEPVTAGDMAPDALVVSPPNQQTAPPPPSPSGTSTAGDTPTTLTPSGHDADTPTTTAGEAGNAIVVRPDDPNATPTPAGDLPPSTTVFDPSADLTTPPSPDITAADLGGLAFPVPDASALVSSLDTAGLKIVRK